MNWVLFWGSRFVPPFVWLSAVRLIVFREPNSPTLWLGPNFTRTFRCHFCMPTDTSEEVADLVATESPADEGEEATDAERVEQPVPQTVEVATEPIVSWAAEDIFAPEPLLEETSATDTDRAEGHLLEVKQEEFQEATTLGAVLSVIGVPEEVADEVATDTADQAFDPVEADTNEVPAEAAFSDLDRVKEEGQDRPAG